MPTPPRKPDTDPGRLRPVRETLAARAQNQVQQAPSPPAPPSLVPSEAMLQFFENAHLPGNLRAVSEPFRALADLMVQTLPRNPERTAALRKLLEAKDCAVRALLMR